MSSERTFSSPTRCTSSHVPLLDALQKRLWRELAAGDQLTADELARRVQAWAWVDLSSALAQLTACGYVTVVGPLARANTRYRIYPQGLAAFKPVDG